MLSPTTPSSGEEQLDPTLWNTGVIESGAHLFTNLPILMKRWCVSGSALDAGNTGVW